MAITTHQIAGPLGTGVASSPQLDWAMGTSWNGELLALQRYLDDVAALFAKASTPLALGFLALEFRCAVIETIEYVGGIVHAIRRPPTLSHTADNRALADVFTALKAGVSQAEVAAILFLPPTAPSAEDPSDAERLARAYGHALTLGGLCLADVAGYWLEHIDTTRWFRHCPTFLSVEDTYRVDPSENPSREAGRVSIAGLDDALYTFVHMDQRLLQHETMRREDVRVARHILRIALDIIVTSFGNRVLAPDSLDPAERLRKLPRSLTTGLAAEDVTLLSEHGPYFIVD